LVESVEQRVLFAFDVTAQAFNPGQPQLVFTDIASGNTNGSGASPTQSVTLHNNTGSGITITAASIIDDPAVAGDHAGQFEASNFPATPVTVPGNGTATFNIAFRAATTGVKSAILSLNTNDPSQPHIDVALRGIGTGSETSGDVGGDKEPSLQRILSAFNIPVNVGDDNEADTFLPTPPLASSQEVQMQRLRKAGAGPVVIQPLAGYGFNTKTGPVGHFGTYTPGTTANKSELFAVNVNERSSTNPTWGGTFDPGNADFALYGDFNGSLFEINGLPRGVYSEDKFNTWDTANKRKVRFYPLKNKDGSVVPNAFIFAFEEFNSGYDSNDIIGIIRNVQAVPAGPEVGTDVLNRNAAGPTRMLFNRIQIQPPDPREETDGTLTPLPNNVVHDKETLRVHNSGSQPLTISSAVLSNTSDFKINTANVNGASIPAGGQLDIEVQFIGGGGAHTRSGTLTLNTNDADEPAVTVNLQGYWQNKSENNEEPSLPTVVQMLGFGTTIVGNGQALNPAGQLGKVQAVGDEVLSPFWRRADAARAVEVVQINAYHTHNEQETFRWYYRGQTALNPVFTHNAVDAQSFFPRLADGSGISAGAFKPTTQGGDTNPAFGIRIQNENSDPTKNVQEQPGGGFGHHIRFWPVKDAQGKVIPNTYLMGMDYQSVNFDYQDNIYLLRNVTPADVSVAPPAAPAGLTATPSTGGIGLNWNDNAEANLAGYNVYRGTAADFVPSAANRLNAAPLTTSEFNDVNAPAGVESFYKVTAVNTGGGESGAASVAAVRPSEQPGNPNTPTGLNAVPASPTSVNVSWLGSAGATRYILERRALGGQVFTVLSDTLTATNFTDTGLSPNTTYEYRVSAANNAGPSAPSAVVTATTPPTTGGGQTPSVTISDASVTEPASGSGPVNATFTVSLSAAPSTTPVILNYTTADQTATAGTDYTAATGTISFAAGETSKTIDVPVLADALAEPVELFAVNLMLANGSATATIADGTGVAAINDVSSPQPGAIPFGGKTAATFTGTNGKPVRVSIKGPGTGSVEMLPGGGVSISVTGSTAASALTVKGAAALQDVTVNGSLKSFSGKTADLAGAMAVDGGLGKLLLRNVSGAAPSISVGSAGVLSATLANASDLTFTSASPVKSLKVSQWLDTGGPGEVLTAPALSSLSVKGDFAADIAVGALGKVTVKGAVTGSDIRATGNIASVRAGAMHDSRVFAGVNGNVSTLPAALTDFAAPARIGSVSVSGKSAGSFSNTLIAASDIGKLSLGAIATANNGTPFGVAGDTIGSVSAQGAGGGKITLRALDDPSESTGEGDFVVRAL
jgi:hypothetical protein